MNYEEIGKFIAKIRKEKNLTQKDLAGMIGVTDKAVSKWERGLGCPDVSLLEDLSKVLDVSILEILKGRKIDKSELEKNDVNEYVVDTINYSKNEIENKYKKFILNVLSIIIVGIVGFLFILNIYHIFYLSSRESYSFDDNKYLDNARTNLDKISKNIEIIKSNKIKFTKQENEQLLKTIEEQYNFFVNHPILKYEGKVDFTINDLYILDNSYDRGKLNLYYSYEILEKYDSSLKGYKEHYFMNLIYTSYGIGNLRMETYNLYEYNTANIDDKLNTYKIETRIFDIVCNVEELLILSDNIIKVGVISE